MQGRETEGLIKRYLFVGVMNCVTGKVGSDEVGNCRLG